MDDHATFPGFFDPWILDHDSKTTDNWNFDLAWLEPRIAFPPDVVDVLHPMVTFDYWDHRIDGDGNVDCRIGGGRTYFVRGAEINLTLSTTLPLI